MKPIDRAAAAIAFAVLALAPLPARAVDLPPTYAVHGTGTELGSSAGEPSLGANWRSGAVLYIAGLETLRATFDDSTTPAAATWQDVSALQTSLTTFDPILFTDSATGRTFVSQLLPTKLSLMAYTDDDGATWNPSVGSGLNSGVDHQTVGGGPFAPGLLRPLTSYPHIVYYCSQDVAMAQCATSLDGGITFGLAVPIYTLLQCGGLHGHVKVAPDGTAYVPNKDCGGKQGIAVSRNNGLTWTVRTVPGSTAGDSDPSLGIARDGTIYLGFAGGDGHARVAVSHDRGLTWSSLQDVGASLGLQNVVFPAVVAGDPNRAAFAFLGTTAAGAATGDDPSFPAVWRLYVAHTYDGGATWSTVDVAPGDVVQRGTICMAGTGCGTTRNLLDFMDVTADAQCRVLVAYADGCLGGCDAGGPNSFTAETRIARQKSGKRLCAAFD